MTYQHDNIAPGPANGVVITDIDIPMTRWIMIILKTYFAVILILVLVLLVGGIIMAILGSVFGVGPMMMMDQMQMR